MPDRAAVDGTGASQRMRETPERRLPRESLPLAGFTHMVPDPLVTERLWERIATWFKETL